MTVDWKVVYTEARWRFVDAVAARNRLEADLALSDMKQAVADGQAEAFLADLEALGRMP